MKINLSDFSNTENNRVKITRKLQKLFGNRLRSIIVKKSCYEPTSEILNIDIEILLKNTVKEIKINL